MASTFHPNLQDKSLTSKTVKHKIKKRKNSNKALAVLMIASDDSDDDDDGDDDDDISLEVERKAQKTVVDYSSDSSIEIAERVTKALHSNNNAENVNINVSEIFHGTQKKVKKENPNKVSEE